MAQKLSNPNAWLTTCGVLRCFLCFLIAPGALYYSIACRFTKHRHAPAKNAQNPKRTESSPTQLVMNCRNRSNPETPQFVFSIKEKKKNNANDDAQ